MVAARNLEDAPRIGVKALLDVLHPGAVHADRYLIFGLARDGAGVASDAFAVVDDEAVFHSRERDWNHHHTEAGRKRRY